MRRFFERVQAKAENVAEAPVSIVVLGDSVTQGVMEHRQLNASVVYHRQLQERLEAFFPTATFNMINAGVAGGGARQALERLDRDVIRHRPDLVLIAFGLNDCLGGEDGISGFGEALRSLANRIRQETEAGIIFMTPPWMAQRKSFRIHPQHEEVAERIIAGQNSGALAAYAGMIRQVACETGALLVDVHAEWDRLARSGLDTDLWLINGLNHPDARGHRLAADLLFHRLLTAYDALR